MVILSEACKPGNWNPRNSLQEGFNWNRNLPSIFVEFCSFLESLHFSRVWRNSFSDQVVSVNWFLQFCMMDSGWWILALYIFSICSRITSFFAQFSVGNFSDSQVFLFHSIFLFWSSCFSFHWFCFTIDCVLFCLILPYSFHERLLIASIEDGL